MAKTNKEPSRFQWKVNHYVGLVLILILFVAVNFIAEKRYLRSNLAASNYTKITELSQNLVGSLDGPVEIINYISPQDDPMSAMIIPDVEKLLDEYVYFSNGKVTVRRIDPYLDFELAREVSEDFKVALQENVLIIKVGEQHNVLHYCDLEAHTDNPRHGSSPSRRSRSLLPRSSPWLRKKRPSSTSLPVTGNTIRNPPTMISWVCLFWLPTWKDRIRRCVN